MKKILIRLGILLLIFLAGVIGFSSFMNKETTDNKMDMEAASLPVLAMKDGDRKINRMYGYAQEMEVDFMRDSLTPVGTEKGLTVSIQPYDHKIQSLVYEVRTSDGSKVIENAKIKNFEDEDGEKTASFNLDKSILMNQEYSLVFTLNTDKGSWHYYTRILQRTGLNTDKYLEFVESFSSKTFRKENAAELSTYLESDSSAGNNSFNNLNIHSSSDMVTWGSLAPSISKTGIPTIKDINETTGSISLTYFMTAKDEEGNEELYQVDEFYRMRYNGTRVLLLDFERSAKEIFTGNEVSVSKGKIDLGVTSKEVQYVAGQTGDVIAFVQQGDLWLYNISTNKLTRVFSFREEDNDERGDYSGHDYKIVRVEENGDMDFVLYGYMNRGEHEGYVGTCVYHYYSEQNVLEERFFLPDTKSYEFLERDLEILSYVSTSDMLYLLLDGNLYQINMADKTYQVIREDIDKDCFVASNTHGHVAWMEEMDADQSSNIVFMDLDTGEQRNIKADEGTKIRAIGFINEDLVYGIARDSDIVVDATGNLRFAMNEIRIVNSDGEVVKNYQQDQVYIMDVNIQQGLLELIRAKWEQNQYVEITSDHIMNNVKVEGEESVSIATATTVRQAGITRLIFAEDSSNKNPLRTESKMMVNTSDTVLNMQRSSEEKETGYYVYARGGLAGVYESPAQAVKKADEMTGVVLNREQQYVWERGNLKTRMNLNLDDIPDCFKSASLDVAYLQESLGDTCTVMNLTGCTLEQVLYQVSVQRPVIVRLADGQTRVIVGYDSYNTLLYDPATGETKYMGMNDSTASFEAGGNIFISYMERLPE